MNRAGRLATWIVAAVLLALAGWILVKVEEIADRVAVRPVSIEQMRQIVMDAIGKEGGMIETPVTDAHGRTHRVRTVFREKGSEEETEAEFQQRHITRCRMTKTAWDQVPP